MRPGDSFYHHVEIITEYIVTYRDNVRIATLSPSIASERRFDVKRVALEMVLGEICDVIIFSNKGMARVS